MIFIYPLGGKSLYDNFEIKASIAGIRKYCKAESIEIVISGQIPNDVAKLADHTINHPIVAGTRYNQVIHNFMRAVEEVNPDEFILMNDDFFCVADFDPDEMPMWYDMTIQEKQKRSAGTYKRVIQTSEFIPGDLSYAVHFPMPIRRVDDFYSICKYIINKQASIRNMYGNAVTDRTELKPDRKFMTSTSYEKSLYLISETQDWFSVGDAFLNDNIVRYIKSLYDEQE